MNCRPEKKEEGRKSQRTMMLEFINLIIKRLKEKERMERKTSLKSSINLSITPIAKTSISMEEEPIDFKLNSFLFDSLLGMRNSDKAIDKKLEKIDIK